MKLPVVQLTLYNFSLSCSRVHQKSAIFLLKLKVRVLPLRHGNAPCNFYSTVQWLAVMIQVDVMIGVMIDLYDLKLTYMRLAGRPWPVAGIQADVIIDLWP